MKANKEKSNIGKKILIIAIFIGLVAIIINLAPNYIRKEINNKINVIINNNDVTKSMKFDAFIGDNEVIYLSTKDIANFFDEDIFYDNKYNQIITSSETKLAALPLEKDEIYVNSSKIKIYGKATKKEENFYLPFSEMKNIYNVEINYIKETNIITIDSLDKEQKKGNASKDIDIKYMPTIFSKSIDKVTKGNSMTVIEQLDNGWVKVRTKLGKIGYTKDITNIYTLRENIENKKQIEGKVSLVWDYFSEYANAPSRTGKIEGVNVVSPAFVSLKKSEQGELNINIGDSGKNYIQWAHNNDYKVWMMVSNNSYKETTSDILNDYKLRENLINKLINITIQYDIDGINIDFEYIKGTDKDMFSRFIIELAPRLKEYGKVLSVDVTAPDGSEDWSMCYNRYKIGKVADYIVFMAYDQNGTSSPKEGTTAGADWVEVNIKKFLGQEGVEKDKIILGMPFYTRLWKETQTTPQSNVVSMKNIDSVLPDGIEKKWNEDLKQYYVEYQKNDATYKMWLEEEESIKAKFDLMNEYDLAGAAYWQKDMEKSTIWSIVEEKINN
ncbi:MAG: hypothetical protein GX682_06290 [Clostridiaceae bacterium]|nr:hypothetical protein [Clostridiaceae bacterium]